jgi:oxygen-independent coproporphyrinogen-3 oxidase
MIDQAIKMPLGLYIHIPFCKTLCYYCDFAIAIHRTGAAERYLQALGVEMTSHAGLEVRTIYLGGGTPTTLTAEQLASLLSDCRRHFRVWPNSEVTVEANPGTLDEAKLVALKDGGVSRLSIGFQVADDDLLMAIGRSHSVREFTDDYALARKVGFSNISLDLIFALPGQSVESWKETLSVALDLRPEHISIYGLTIEKGTAFGRWQGQGKLQRPSEEEELAMYDLTVESLARDGYEHYEISNFARRGFRSAHNQIYWRNEEYLGLGVSAWSYMDKVRYGNDRSTRRYIDLLLSGASPVAEEEKLVGRAEMAETLILGLRMIEGVSLSRFQERFGVKAEGVFEREIEKMHAEGLLEVSNDHLRLTDKGIRLANEVFVEFL